MAARKLQLDLDALHVDTFEPDPRLRERGTVFGNACSDTTCFQIICDDTWGGPGTCEATEVNCSGGGGTGGSAGGTCTCPRSNEATCCTGFQIQCSCLGGM